jgi:hypothetical protein
MNKNIQRLAGLLIITFIALTLSACESMGTTTPEFSTVPVNIDVQNAEYAFAQATIEAGQRQLDDLSRKATEVSLNLNQAADAAARSTQDYNERRKMELDFESTIISKNMAEAAATQEIFLRRTQLAGDATTAAQSSAATATQAAYVESLNIAVQAQVLLDIQSRQTAQAVAAMTTYPLTATPMAGTQAVLLAQQYNREEQSFVDRFVNPWTPILAVIVLILFIIAVILAFRRYILPVTWPRRLLSRRANREANLLTMIDGVIAENDLDVHHSLPPDRTLDHLPKLPDKNTAHIEIINATEPPVAHWVAEVESQLAFESRYNG